MFTIKHFEENGWLIKWNSIGHECPARSFWYTPQWMVSLDQLIKPSEKPKASFDLSPAGRVKGLVDQFVIGKPLELLARPKGYGKNPIFQKMLAPHQRVLELSTKDTRTFGFFVRPNQFIAVCLRCVSDLKDEDGKSINSKYIEAAELVAMYLNRLSSTFEVESEISDYVN